MIEALIGQGVTRIEAGRGDYDYKLSYGGKSVAVWQILLFRNTRRNRLRLRWLLAWSDLLHLFYYRIRSLKFAPKLRKRFGLPARPLWRSWISNPAVKGQMRIRALDPADWPSVAAEFRDLAFEQTTEYASWPLRGLADGRVIWPSRRA